MRRSSVRFSREAGFVVLYTAGLLTYLFLRPEGELLHWISLVALPVAGLALFGRHRSARALVASLGLERARLGRGWWLVLVLGAGFQAVQLLNGAQRAAVLGALRGPRALLLLPLAFLLLLATAATTEELFFRGVLQSRLADALGSEVAALLLGTGIFVVYHLPYAYLNPAWPSAGDLGAATEAAVANGLLGGLPLSFVYWRSGRNLAAAIVLHAAIDLVPAVRLVDRMLGAA